MHNPEPDRSLPRTSSTYHFLNEEEFNKIPRSILDAAAARGNRGHKLIELNWNTNLDNPIVNMFREGLERIQGNRTMPLPQIEVQLNGGLFTGKPDFRWGDCVIDYKFTRDRLRPETAIQLSLYSFLIEEMTRGNIFNHFAFHYHQDGGLFIYRIPDRAIEPLRKFGLSLVEHYDDIQAGKLIKYDKMNEWDRLQLEYDVFEPFHTIMPPMEIVSEDQAKLAISKYNTDIKLFEARFKQCKSAIRRYMDEEGKTRLYDLLGGGVRLQVENHKQFDKEKLAAYKQTIITGTKEVIKLMRFDPPKDTQKQLN